jgi:RimJ/RimL family protein N-acetyltransferase
MAGITPPPIVTPRLVLEPVTAAVASAVVAGDLSSLEAAEGWPHDDTLDAMRMMTEPDAGPGWFITAGGRVIGDCGAFAWPDRSGTVEIGYGLAAPARGRGYATEAVRALCSWLVTDTGAAVITAVTDADGNRPSRRVLEKIGFAVTAEDDGQVSYALTAAGITP